MVCVKANFGDGDVPEWGCVDEVLEGFEGDLRCRL